MIMLVSEYYLPYLVLARELIIVGSLSIVGGVRGEV